MFEKHPNSAPSSDPKKGERSSAEKREVVNREALIRAAESAGRIASYALAGLAFLGVATAANHARTRYEVHSAGTGFNQSFSHPDAETQRLMDFFTGKAGAPESFKLQADRETVRRMYESYLVAPPEGMYAMERPELRTLLVSLLTKEHIQDPELYAGVTLSGAYTKIPFDPELYRAAWDTLADNGAPRFRVSSPDGDMEARLSNVLAGTGRAFYNPFTNTIYLTPSSARPTYLAELAHSRQFDRDPARAYAMVAKTLLDTATDTVTHLESPVTAWDRQYDRPGTLEGEAHGVESGKGVLSDNQGLEGTVRDEFETRYLDERKERLGPVDDPSRYKPLRKPPGA